MFSPSGGEHGAQESDDQNQVAQQHIDPLQLDRLDECAECALNGLRGRGDFSDNGRPFVGRGFVSETATKSVASIGIRVCIGGFGISETSRESVIRRLLVRLFIRTIVVSEPASKTIIVRRWGFGRSEPAAESIIGRFFFYFRRLFIVTESASEPIVFGGFFFVAKSTPKTPFVGVVRRGRFFGGVVCFGGRRGLLDRLLRRVFGDDALIGVVLYRDQNISIKDVVDGEREHQEHEHRQNTCLPTRDRVLKLLKLS